MNRIEVLFVICLFLCTVFKVQKFKLIDYLYFPLLFLPICFTIYYKGIENLIFNDANNFITTFTMIPILAFSFMNLDKQNNKFLFVFSLLVFYLGLSTNSFWLSFTCLISLWLISDSTVSNLKIREIDSSLILSLLLFLVYSIIFKSSLNLVISLDNLKILLLWLISFFLFPFFPQIYKYIEKVEIYNDLEFFHGTICRFILSIYIVSNIFSLMTTNELIFLSQIVHYNILFSLIFSLFFLVLDGNIKRKLIIVLISNLIFSYQVIYSYYKAGDVTGVHLEKLNIIFISLILYFYIYKYKQIKRLLWNTKTTFSSLYKGMHYLMTFSILNLPFTIGYYSKLGIDIKDIENNPTYLISFIIYEVINAYGCVLINRSVSYGPAECSKNETTKGFQLALTGLCLCLLLIAGMKAFSIYGVS